MLLNGDGVATDKVRAKELLTDAAAHGESHGELELGVMYMQGSGIAQSFALAKSWFEKAAAQDVAEAESNLGSIYEFGSGVSPDPSKAADHYARALVLGEPEAAGYLGKLYFYGTGVQRNVVTAYTLFDIGAGLGCKDCEKQRDTILDVMTPDQIAEGQTIAAGWSIGSPLKTVTSLEAIAPQILFGLDGSTPSNVYQNSHTYVSRNFEFGKEGRYVVFITTSGEECHSCGAKLSAVTFFGQQPSVQGQYPWGFANRDFTEIGGFGVAPTLDDPNATFSSTKRSNFGSYVFDDKVAFMLLKDGYSGMGETLTGSHILTFSSRLLKNPLARRERIGFHRSLD
jgi:hypothetical protein